MGKFGSAFEPLKMHAKLCVSENMFFARKEVHSFPHILKWVYDIKRVKWESGGLLKGDIPHWGLPFFPHMSWLGFPLLF